jgi:hypothetical protein
MFRAPLRSLTLSASAAAMLLCAAPAFAQESPPPGQAAAAVPPPMQAMTAPKGSDDMTGSLGFGVGVHAGMTTLVSTVDSVAVRYWLSDILVVQPSFDFDYLKPSNPGMGMGATWHFAPAAQVFFVPFRSTATRLEVGGGLGFLIGHTSPATNAPTAVNIFVPIHAGVEHFFTRWFSMGIAAETHLIDYQKDVQFESSINTASFVGQLFFYTD